MQRMAGFSSCCSSYCITMKYRPTLPPRRPRLTRLESIHSQKSFPYTRSTRCIATHSPAINLVNLPISLLMLSHYSITLAHIPVLKELTHISIHKLLTHHTDTKLVLPILQNRPYTCTDRWQAAGAFFGRDCSYESTRTVRLTSTETVSSDSLETAAR